MLRGPRPESIFVHFIRNNSYYKLDIRMPDSQIGGGGKKRHPEAASVRAGVKQPLGSQRETCAPRPAPPLTCARAHRRNQARDSRRRETRAGGRGRPRALRANQGPAARGRPAAGRRERSGTYRNPMGERHAGLRKRGPGGSVVRAFAPYSPPRPPACPRSRAGTGGASRGRSNAARGPGSTPDRGPGQAAGAPSGTTEEAYRFLLMAVGDMPGRGRGYAPCACGS